VSLDRHTVKTIATLARLRVDDQDLDGLAKELSAILGWVEQLGQIDTEGVAPMTSVAAMDVALRLDAVTDGDCRDAVLANAPAAIDGCFTVPKVVE
jgi:aspartyl-tRNA(Asn)/glutamyl-tRNA(Gln) amidotransferase subunit C